MSEKTRRVLLCGGHLDGRWVDVPTGQRTVRALKRQDVTVVLREPDLSVDLDFEEYYLEPMPIKIRSAGGGPLWVGSIGYGPDRDEAILRGLLQRDVAQQLLGDH